MEKKIRKKDRSSKPSPEQSEAGKLKDAGTGSTFLRFTGVGFEMLATIGVGVTAGYYADKYFQLQFPVFLLSLSFISLFGSLYLLYKRLPKE
ncbi:AtpZ/AtpI family protein [Imperialibacter roseus]|uniref:AtpZ/AtpI family protein n=1 Tax=Imperialibacter roseus TaxID=1324217 RepID=A0ABZ0ILP7_9BACT|nr:AtpZ/AtpI family protein [Imperialibacter roseus]WOK05944.1 AtpZ/AtpI family protein [Imperialibacter roseus]